MASISSLSFLSSINNVSATNYSSSFSLFPPSRKPCNNPKRHHHVAKVSCNGSNQNNVSPTNPEGEGGEEQQLQLPSSNIQGNRRDVLIGLGSGLAATTFGYNPLASARAEGNNGPVSPDLKTCGPPNLPAGAKPTLCCPPKITSASANIKQFKLPKGMPKIIRQRQAAHLVSDDYVAMYKEAITKMKNLPDDDPRSFTQQANIHCAYCHNSYRQAGFPKLDFQVHSSWLFLPWHRWYLYFYERILGSLIQEPTFALPFWNWDAPEGMEMPSEYTDSTSPLYSPLRNANHQPPTLIDLNWNRGGVDSSGNVEANLATMYRQVYEVKSQTGFFGQPFYAGQTPYTSRTGSGSLELVPHNTVHSWTGDNTQPNYENMGALYSAARDPIFYSHHANVDRMWNLWKKFGRTDINNSSYLNSSFYFYDEHQDLVEVTIQDSLNTTKLGYDYQYLGNLPWINSKPKPRRRKPKKRPSKPTAETLLPFTLSDRIVSAVVKRPKRSRSREEKEEKEETLMIEIEFDRCEALKFDVLINEEEDKALATPLNREFAGSFVNISHMTTNAGGGDDERRMSTALTFSIGITNVLEDLEADDDDDIVVTLVPQYGKGATITNIKIECQDIIVPSSQ